jgi:YqaJ-like recombinase protein
MSQPSRATFIADRRDAIGGSDAASLLSHIIDVDYGCRRRLWYDKSGISPDEPDAQTEFMTLGNVAEPYIRRFYADYTGRTVTEVARKRHPSIDCISVNLDGIADPAPDEEDRSPLVIECKAIGRQLMYKMQADGLTVDYLIQGNHGCLVHGLERSAFVVATREDILPIIAIDQATKLTGEAIPTLPRRPKLVWFDQPRNQELCELIEQEAPVFWETLGDPARIPDRLPDSEDPRCGRCAYQVRCRGSEILGRYVVEDDPKNPPFRADLGPLVEEYRVARAVLDDAEKLVSEVEDKWKLAMGKLPAVAVPVWNEEKQRWGQKNVYHRVQRGRETIDGRAMVSQYEALRKAAIDARLPGAELTRRPQEFVRIGMPSQPLRLQYVLPEKPKKKGEVPEVDDASDD